MKPRKHKSELIFSLMEEISDLEYEKTKNKMIVSANIDRLLRKTGISKGQLAESLEKTPSEVTRWLSGTVNIQIDTQTEIAHFFKVPVYELSMPIQEQTITKVYYINTQDFMQARIKTSEWQDTTDNFIITNQLPIPNHGGKC